MATHPVIVAGKRPPMLLSLKRLLEPEFEVAAMADNVLSMADALSGIAPELLVIDTGSVEFGGVDLARHLCQRNPSLAILLVGDEAEPPPNAAPPGHTAYVWKHAAKQSLLPTARDLLARLHAGPAPRAPAPSSGTPPLSRHSPGNAP